MHSSTTVKRTATATATALNAKRARTDSEKPRNAWMTDVASVSTKLADKNGTTFIEAHPVDANGRQMLMFQTPAMITAGFYGINTGLIGTKSKFAKDKSKSAKEDGEVLVTPNSAKQEQVCWTLQAVREETQDYDEELANCLTAACPPYAKKFDTATEREVYEVKRLEALYTLQSGVQSGRFKVDPGLHAIVEVCDKIKTQVIELLVQSRGAKSNPLAAEFTKRTTVIETDNQDEKFKMIAADPVEGGKKFDRFVDTELSKAMSRSMYETPIKPIVPAIIAGNIVSGNQSAKVVEVYKQYTWSADVICHQINFVSTKLFRELTDAEFANMPSRPDYKDADLAKLWPCAITQKYYVPFKPGIWELQDNGSWLEMTAPSKRAVYSGAMVSNVFTVGTYSVAGTSVKTALHIQDIRVIHSRRFKRDDDQSHDPTGEQESFLPAGVKARLEQNCRDEAELIRTEVQAAREAMEKELIDNMPFNDEDEEC